MIIQCDASHRQALLALLEEEALLNLFLLSDIENYGFAKPFQTVWMETDPAAPAVYVHFYDNLALYARSPRHLNAAFVQKVVQQRGIHCVMGKLGLLRPLRLAGFTLNSKVMCALQKPPPIAEDGRILVAGSADVADIHAFLNSIPEFAGMYTSRSMIADRIATGSGTHLIVRQGGRIICHGNTAAFSSGAVMTGGVATAPAHRRQGHAHRVMMQLCRIIRGQGKVPCTLCSPYFYKAYYRKTGFTFVGDWGMITAGED